METTALRARRPFARAMLGPVRAMLGRWTSPADFVYRPLGLFLLWVRLLLGSRFTLNLGQQRGHVGPEFLPFVAFRFGELGQGFIAAHASEITVVEQPLHPFSK